MGVMSVTRFSCIRLIVTSGPREKEGGVGDAFEVEAEASRVVEWWVNLRPYPTLNLSSSRVTD